MSMETMSDHRVAVKNTFIDVRSENEITMMEAAMLSRHQTAPAASAKEEVSLSRFSTPNCWDSNVPYFFPEVIPNANYESPLGETLMADESHMHLGRYGRCITDEENQVHPSWGAPPVLAHNQEDQQPMAKENQVLNRWRGQPPMDQQSHVHLGWGASSVPAESQEGQPPMAEQNQVPPALGQWPMPAMNAAPPSFPTIPMSGQMTSAPMVCMVYLQQTVMQQQMQMAMMQQQLQLQQHQQQQQQQEQMPVRQTMRKTKGATGTSSHSAQATSDLTTPFTMPLSVSAQPLIRLEEPECMCSWKVDTRKMVSNDTEDTSPEFFWPVLEKLASFKVVLKPVKSSSSKGGSAFKKANGKCTISLVCQSFLAKGSPQVRFQISECPKEDEPACTYGPFEHDFSRWRSCCLSDQVWDLSKYVKSPSNPHVAKAFYLRLEFLPNSIQIGSD